MGDKITLKLDVRTLHGKKAKQLRTQEVVPGVVYGPGIDPISVQAPYNEIEKVWRHAGKHTPVQLTIDAKKKIAMIKQVDMEPSKHRILHVSFHAVNANDPVVAEIPIRLVGAGESEAERAGLVVLQSLDKLEVRALPMDLPEALEVSVLELKDAGDQVTVSSILLPENVELVEHRTGHADDSEDAPHYTDLTIATVYEPSALQAANEAAGGDAEDESEVAVEGEEVPAEGDAKTDVKPDAKSE